MNILKQQKKQQEKAQKEQMEMAKKLVEVANELLETLKTKGLKVYECSLVADLLGKRIQETSNGYVGNKLLSELYASNKDGEKSKKSDE